MNEKYKFTIDKLVSIKEIIKNIEETNYIDGYLGYEDDFYIDSILYYLKENARLKDKIDKVIKLMNSELTDVGMGKCEEVHISFVKHWLKILKEN